MLSHPMRAGTLPRKAFTLTVIAVGTCLMAHGQEFKTAWDSFLSGNYSNAISLATSAVESPGATEDWQALLIRGLLETGRYPEAWQAATNAVARHPRSAVLRWLARKALLHNGQADSASAMATDIIRQALVDRRAYPDAASRAVLGRALLLQGADPKQVLNRLYEPVKQSDPTEREVHLAGGELALEKHDFELAARWFREGLNVLPDDPDLQLGLARAYAPSEPALALQALGSALARNSNHVGSLLMLADRKIDAESYDDAEHLLEAVRDVNPVHPEAWAYEAVLAHLRNQPDAERDARSKALQSWATNPRVDYLMGLKLSQKYRFQEGADHQIQALRFDGGYQPAMLQLAQDLLRLGREDEGWRLAGQAQKMDAYDVTANNLVALQEVVQGFGELTNAHFTLRMEPHEVSVYGARAIAVLERARTELCHKYGFELRQPTTVEIFHRQSDFAVRTFGMPDNDGFLGVCFGHVITANSPSSRPGQPFNWESMLWHEFCHVVTLQLTGNKIPRWLSEGISVYEERQANPAWGEQLTPEYRRMLLGDSLVPVSSLSSAFLNPPSDTDLQFAYYESSLVVEFLVKQYGRDTVIALLRELGTGTPINEALEKHAAPLDRLEPAFVEFAHQTAHALGPRLDWEEPDTMAGPHPTASAGRGTGNPLLDLLRSGSGASDTWNAWAQSHPTNFWVMTRNARQLVSEERWTEAQPILEELVENIPDFVGEPSPYRMLAETYGALENTNAEKHILTEFAAREDEATDVYLRLMEQAAGEKEWPVVIENAQRYLAVDPLVPAPYRYLARAGEATGRTEDAIAAYRALLELHPVNPAGLRFRLAKLLYQTGDPTARRQLLEALEDAPRYREALELLLEMNAAGGDASQSAAGGKET